MTPTGNPSAIRSIYPSAPSSSVVIWESGVWAASVAAYRLMCQTSPDDELSRAERGQMEHGRILDLMTSTPKPLLIHNQNHTHDEFCPLHHETLERNRGSVALENVDEQRTTNEQIEVGQPTSFQSQDILGLGAGLEANQGEKISESIDEADLGEEDTPAPHEDKSGPINDDDDP
ncbi:uncharacterized protein Z518_03352 [Rhinocladiella mackenziei CBS 650.93]|uniref:Uncharacterized protein n=1 Tax=Rhinocladiella mackenziei CBS 650.93 TaxID=1442369 RepID=A0A0D2JH52_9EURO|nr:uncharacterized protein Z518_03352 [Rhinocladiella mackenziei CBS 650.93]KIX08695.1 hypothetical protein Z518_03352 [Rhinocladiella mackenziei CBS 650.93]